MRHTTGFPHSAEKAAGNRRTSNRISLRISSRASHLLTVIVEASDGQLLNSCHPARARELIRKQRAIRISRRPYTIRLIAKQSVTPCSAESWEDKQ